MPCSRMMCNNNKMRIGDYIFRWSMKKKKLHGKCPHTLCPTEVSTGKSFTFSNMAFLWTCQASLALAVTEVVANAWISPLCIQVALGRFRRNDINMYQMMAGDHMSLVSLGFPSSFQTRQATTFAVHPAHAEVEGNLHGSRPFAPGGYSP